MTNPRMPPINFAFTENGRRGIDELRDIYDRAFPDDPAVFPMVAWGIYDLDNGIVFENVIVSFYAKAQADDMRPYLQRVGDIDLVYFITEEYHSKLEGMLIDYRTDDGFFLLDPVTGKENLLPQDVIDSIKI